MKWINIEKKNENSFIKLKMKHINNIYINYRDYIKEQNIKLFPSTYAGIYIDSFVETKMIQHKSHRPIPKYNPILQKQKVGEYKKIILT